VRKRRFAVGLTGGIGSGKTTVADMFGALGAGVIDTDAIAHALTASGGLAMPAIIQAFGRQYALADGALDRARMREHVFANPHEKQRLEAILHPLIRQSCDSLADSSGGAYLIFVVPLLVESGNWRQRVDRILVVDCPEELQIRRVMSRSGLTESQVRAIMATQVSRQARLAAADDVISNANGLDALTDQVAKLHARYLAFAHAL
jgi:dephospho-CoA kinase